MMNDFTKAPKLKKKATEIKCSERTLRAKLYATEIVSVTVESTHASVTLSHGGHRTRTTLRRMNEVIDNFDLPFKVEPHRSWGWVISLKSGGFLPFDETSKSFTVSR